MGEHLQGVYTCVWHCS